MAENRFRGRHPGDGGEKSGFQGVRRGVRRLCEIPFAGVGKRGLLCNFAHLLYMQKERVTGLGWHR
jgi:hypothetical protein